MTQESRLPASIRDRHALTLAQVGAAVMTLALWGCGGTGTLTGDEAGAGGSATGGVGTGGDSGGGAGSGGTASGGAGSGGTASGGADGDTVPACPGFPAASESTGCRSQQDCTAGGSCVENAPSSQICGACFASPMDCTLDAECDDGEVCVVGPEVPCQCMGPGLVCAPACTADSCGEGFVCAGDGHCVLASCDGDGYLCGEGAVCAPERAGGGHGCALALCDVDGFTCASNATCAPERTGDGHGCAARSCVDEGYECPEGSLCEPVDGANAHGCRPIHCTEGAECEANFDCDPTSTLGNGCVRRGCTADTDCDCGACVFGRCESRLFLCVTLPP